MGLSTMPLQQDVDFLEHHGVKGMRWGKRKSAGMPSRGELREMNKVARVKVKAEKKKKAVAADNEILNARAGAKGAKAELKSARQEYRTQKQQIGRVAARDIYNKRAEKPLSTLTKASERTRQEVGVDLAVLVITTFVK